MDQQVIRTTGRFDKPLILESFCDFHFILKYSSFSFLTEIILSLNIIIYIWLLFNHHHLKLILSNEKIDIDKKNIK